MFGSQNGNNVSNRAGSIVFSRGFVFLGVPGAVFQPALVGLFARWLRRGVLIVDFKDRPAGRIGTTHAPAAQIRLQLIPAAATGAVNDDMHGSFPPRKNGVRKSSL
jgi:hypothetical protein